MGMADFNGKVESIQEAPFGYTMSVIGGKWKMVIIYLLEWSVVRKGSNK